MICTDDEQEDQGLGILCAAEAGAVSPPPFAGQAGFVAKDLDADPDRHPHATTSLPPNGLVPRSR